jgi:hypothetical protein
MLNQRLPRRTLLRGLGTALALPALEAMLPSSVLAAPAAKVRPVRMAFFMVPNGVNMDHWMPASEGALNQLPFILEPLESVKQKVTILSGLTQDKARPNGDGPGDHARAGSAFLTGCQPRKTAGADIKAGISVDQYAAGEVGKRTRFRSLELGIDRSAQAGNCDSGYSCAYSSNISWMGESTPVAKEVDPRLVFDRLFSYGDPKETAEQRAKRDQHRLSILDFVQEDAKRLQSRLGVKDQQKLDEYFTGVREIEKRIEFAGKVGAAGPGGLQRPTGVPSEFEDHTRLMFDLMAVAFQADLTRIATFMYANEGSNRSYPKINVTDGHHNLSHHQKDAEKLDKIRKINRLHVELFAHLLQKLDSMPEGNGTVLDNTMLVYGSGIGDGDRHNHDDLPIILAGKGGGTIQSGRHLVYPKDTPLNNLFLSMLDRANVPCASLGDSTGRLNNLG